MKSKMLSLAAIGLASVAVAACHHHNNNESTVTPPATKPPPTSTGMSLDTAQVLTLAQQTSETSSPFIVAGGALVLTDTSETTTAIMVDAQ